MQTNHTEKREVNRIAFSVPIWEDLPAGGRVVRAKDICETGMCYTKRYGDPRPDGLEVTLRFCLPTEPEHQIRAQGFIIDERCFHLNHDTSIRFLSIDQADAKRIRNYVEHQTTRHATPRPTMEIACCA